MRKRYRRGLFELLHEAAMYDMKTFGRGGVGVALALRSVGPNPWATVRELAPETALSTAQLRRRLDRLVDEGKVDRVSGAGTHFYMLGDECSREYAELIERQIEKARALQKATGLSYTESAD